jgi:hypothetical protein
MITLEIRSAVEQRTINEVTRQREEQERRERQEKAIEKFFNYCKKQIETSSYESIWFTLMRKDVLKFMDVDYLSSEDENFFVKQVVTIVKDVLAEAGYELGVDIYSVGWQNRSGKYASCHIKF